MSTSSHEVSLPGNCSLVVKEDYSYLLGFRRLHLPLKAVNGVKVLLFSKTSLYLLVAECYGIGRCICTVSSFHPFWSLIHLFCVYHSMYFYYLLLKRLIKSNWLPLVSLSICFWLIFSLLTTWMIENILFYYQLLAAISGKDQLSSVSLDKDKLIMDVFIPALSGFGITNLTYNNLPRDIQYTF